MSKKIVLNLSADSIQDALEEVRKYRKSLDEKCEKLREKVAESISEDAQYFFSRAVVDMYLDGYETGYSPNISIENTDNKTKVIATGSEVAFIEFGAGVFGNGGAGTSPHPKGAELGLTIGSYGKGYGKRRTWSFEEAGETVLTHGTPASMPMYNALEQVRYDLVDIAKEVFSND